MELIQHQTSCNRHIPSSISFIYQDRIASELMANSGIWPKCISINGCEHTDKWKHMTWWNCRNSNSANDLHHDNQLVSNGCIYLQGYQSLLQSNAFRGSTSPWGSEVLSPLQSRPERKPQTFHLPLGWCRNVPINHKNWLNLIADGLFVWNSKQTLNCGTKLWNTLLRYVINNGRQRPK